MPCGQLASLTNCSINIRPAQRCQSRSRVSSAILKALFNSVVAEAHRALELLEEYHAELQRPSDTELRLAIEKVIGIFKTNLFQALCDIQGKYVLIKNGELFVLQIWVCNGLVLNSQISHL